MVIIELVPSSFMNSICYGRNTERNTREIAQNCLIVQIWGDLHLTSEQPPPTSFFFLPGGARTSNFFNYL